MAIDQTFVNQETVIQDDWLNNVNTHVNSKGSAALHAANRISVSAIAGMTSTETQAALAELNTNKISTTQAQGIIQSGAVVSATGGGTADAITATLSPAPAALTNGMRVQIKASGANTSTTPTLNLNSLGAKTIVKLNNQPLFSGDIAGAGQWIDVIYDSTLDKWVLENPATTSSFVSFKNLKITTTGTNSLVTLTSDAVTVENVSFLSRTLRNVSLSINLTSSGANGLDTGSVATSTFYYIYVVYNPSTNTIAGLASLSATSPTLPSGYTMPARAGAILTDGTANKYPLSGIQVGRRFQYKPAAGSNLTALPTLASGTLGSISVPTWVAVSVGNFVPTTAVMIGVHAFSGVGGGAIAAPNNSYGGYQSSNQPPVNTGGTTGTDSQCSNGWLVLESTNIYVASIIAGGLFQCLGWEDNI